MNYKRIYNIINKRKSERPTKYSERHHIIPRCLGGDDSLENLIIVTAREHYILHAILCKIYPNNKSLKYAFNMMHCDGQQGRRYNKSVLYHLAKNWFSENHPCKDDITKEKISVSLKKYYSIFWVT